MWSCPIDLSRGGSPGFETGRVEALDQITALCASDGAVVLSCHFILICGYIKSYAKLRLLLAVSNAGLQADTHSDLKSQVVLSE